MLGHRLCHPSLQPFDRERCRYLSQKTSRIGKARLDSDHSPNPDIVLIGRFGEQCVEETTTMLQRRLCFEQRGNVDAALYPE